jgi:HEAT repeat protein
VKLRPPRLAFLAIWGALAPAALTAPLLPSSLSGVAHAAPPKVKTTRHSGAFSLSIPFGPTRLQMSVAYEPTARTLTLNVIGKDLIPARTVQVPEFTGRTVRSELVPLPGREHALVLSFGEPKPYVVVILAPLATALTGVHDGSVTDRSVILADAVVLKGFLVGADGVESSLSTSEGQDGFRLLLSEPASDKARLCGHLQQSTRTLDVGRGRFVRVAVPVLGTSERRGAKKLAAKPDGAGRDVYLGEVPSAFETAPFSADPLMDADAARRALPYEARQVLLPAGANIGSLVVEVQQPAPADASWDLWLWTESAIFEVDTSGVRGAPSFVVDLPEELRAGCLALSVGPRSPFVEVRGRLPEDAAALGPAGQALAGSGAELALRELALRTSTVVPELTETYGSLPEAARTQAESLARLAEPSLAEGFWVRQLLDGSEGEQIRGRARLGADDDDGRGAIGRALRAAKAKDELPLAQTLAELSPAAALRPIAYRLTQRSPARRLELRKVLAELTAEPTFLEEVNALVAEPSASRKQKVEVLRAVAPAVRSLSAAAQTEAWKLLASAQFEEAYVLVPVVLGFGVKTPPARDLLQHWLAGEQLKLAPRELAALRTEILTAAAEQEQASPELAKRAVQLLEDPFVRVRASAATYLATAKVAASEEASSALAQRLRRDDWPAVREASLGALGSVRSEAKFREDAEAAVIRALAKDAEPSVRSRAARTLAELPTEDSLSALRRSLDKDESAAVRAEAARSLGLLCDQASLAALTSAARWITRGARDEADVRLALNAVTALSRLGPPDLKSRIQPLTSDSVPGPLRGRIDAAVEAGRGGCATAEKR